jgi:hypothetical protein
VAELRIRSKRRLGEVVGDSCVQRLLYATACRGYFFDGFFAEWPLTQWH